MSDVLGESGTKATLFHLKFGDIPYEPEKINNRLVELFNKGGARMIERQVLKRLFDEMGEMYEDVDGLSFATQIERAESEYRNTLRNRHE